MCTLWSPARPRLPSRTCHFAGRWWRSPSPLRMHPGSCSKASSGRPLPVLITLLRRWHRAVQRLVGAGDYDLIHLDSIHMIRYAALPRNGRARTRVVLNWHNIESEVTMLRYSDNAPSSARRWYAKQTAHKLEVARAPNAANCVWTRCLQRTRTRSASPDRSGSPYRRGRERSGCALL